MDIDERLIKRFVSELSESDLPEQGLSARAQSIAEAAERFLVEVLNARLGELDPDDPRTAALRRELRAYKEGECPAAGEDQE